ncbi:hypothetical protein BJ165DRAFT_1566617 [Panaeolus papilionaceus]|nr:hypothetical protein BJ165DRAFT_1566617 [Panaeolus papilionaceus]
MTRPSRACSMSSATQSASSAPKMTKSTQMGLRITLAVYWRKRKRRVDSVIIEDAEGIGIGLNGSGAGGGRMIGPDGMSSSQLPMSAAANASGPFSVIPGATSSLPNSTSAFSNDGTATKANGTSKSNRCPSKPRPWGAFSPTRPSIDVSSLDEDDPPPLITLSNDSSSSSLSFNHASGSGSGSGSTSPPRRMRPAPPIPAERASGLGKPLVPVKVYRPSPLSPNPPSGVNEGDAGSGQSTWSILSATSLGSGNPGGLVKPSVSEKLSWVVPAVPSQTIPTSQQMQRSGREEVDAEYEEKGG